MVNYPCNYDWTRIGEYKHFLPLKSERTIVSYEYPQAFELGKNERYYPLQTAQARAQYEAYRALQAEQPGVSFLGRLGDYQYYDMDKAVERALVVAQSFLKKGSL